MDGIRVDRVFKVTFRSDLFFFLFLILLSNRIRAYNRQLQYIYFVKRRNSNLLLIFVKIKTTQTLMMQ